MPRDQFVDRLAYRWGELTALHRMSDGNTRSQSAFVTQLAAAAGYRIDWERVDVDELRNVRLHAVASSERPLADYLRYRVESFTDHDRVAQHDAMTGLSSNRPAGTAIARIDGDAATRVRPGPGRHSATICRRPPYTATAAAGEQEQ